MASAVPEMGTQITTLMQDLMAKSKEEIVVLGFNDDLDVVKPDSSSCVFRLRVTPALLATGTGVALVAYILWRWHVVGINWDPFGLSKFSGVIGDAGKGIRQRWDEIFGGWG